MFMICIDQKVLLLIYKKIKILRKGVVFNQKKVILIIIENFKEKVYAFKMYFHFYKVCYY